MSGEVDLGAPHIFESRTLPRWTRAVLGLVAGAVSLAFGSLMAALISAPSPIDAVGTSFIDRTPAWLKELAISWFGSDNKIALRVGMFIVLGVLAIALGAISRSSPAPLVLGIAALGVLGMLAILERPGSAVGGILAVTVGIASGSIAAGVIWRSAMARTIRSSTPSPSRVPLEWDRRSFLRTATAIAASSAVAAGFSVRGERERLSRSAAQRPASLPPVMPGERSVGTPTSVHEDIRFITPNDEFYRIDTALSFPTVDLDQWEIRIRGMVEREIRLTYRDLLDLPQVERTITLCCVSNEVGGPYIGNAVWQGPSLADVLESASPLADAEQVFSTSLDGWTCGFPLSTAMDGRDALIAIGMNGEPLPLRHGFPARLVVPGLYGYVSATKWLSEIELNRWSDARGYWIPRGWSRLAPVKTQSRIDVPRRNATVVAGPTPIAGVAWAQHVGIDKVEVRIDSGPWEIADLSEDVSDDTWRMWKYVWSATPGTHVVQVRATDKSGSTQTETVSPVAPDGATGWHTRRITVAEVEA